MQTLGPYLDFVFSYRQGTGEEFNDFTVDRPRIGKPSSAAQNAIEHFGTSLILVLGHQRCGAVEAAVSPNEIEMAEKRADYFAAGTQVVWDVDPVNEYVHVYRASSPTQPTTYHRGQVAEAEPAVPGWQMAVDQIFG